MNYLIFGDLHITQSSLEECEKILNEILMLCNKYSITNVIDLGDTFNNLRPISLELDLFAKFIKNLNRPITIISADSHESTTKEESILNHYGILSNNVSVVKEYKDTNHMYCGHFILKESNISYGAKLSKEDLKNYLYVFLGHQHSFQIIKPNCVQLGSCRYIDFSEAVDKQKVIAIISDYGLETEQVHFLKLKSPIPMVELKLSKNASKEAPGQAIKAKNEGAVKSIQEPNKSISEGENPLNPSQIDLLCQQLDKLPPKTKVKIKIEDFESFRLFLPLVNKYSSKFEVFKYETSFEVVSTDREKLQSTETKSFKESFNNWLSKQNIDSKIKDILLKEIE